MKKLIILLSFMFVLTGCGSNITKDYTVDIKATNNCKNKAKKYYSDGDQTIYLVCASGITLKDGKNSVSLKSYLKKDDNTIDKVIDEIITKVMPDSSLMNGAVTVYPDGGTVKYTKNGYTIVKCNTSDKNKDIYIGTDKLDLEKGFKAGFCGHDE